MCHTFKIISSDFRQECTEEMKSVSKKVGINGEYIWEEYVTMIQISMEILRGWTDSVKRILNG